MFQLYTCSAGDFAASEGKTLKDFNMFTSVGSSRESFREAESELEKRAKRVAFKPVKAITDVVYYNDKLEYHVRGVVLTSLRD